MVLKKINDRGMVSIRSWNGQTILCCRK